jgi:hypothetical protein
MQRKNKQLILSLNVHFVYFLSSLKINKVNDIYIEKVNVQILKIIAFKNWDELKIQINFF